ncbi:hypothetical protein QOT17_024941 [Balamuthia mandrillaris]
MPTSNVPSSSTSPHTKAKSHKKSYITVERFLKRLIEFLKAGDFTYSMESCLAPLAPSTIASYVSFIREAVIQGLISGHGEDILKEESNDKTYQMLVLLCGKLDHISHFVRAQEADQFVRHSQVNLMCARLWHLG